MIFDCISDFIAQTYPRSGKVGSKVSLVGVRVWYESLFQDSHDAVNLVVHISISPQLDSAHLQPKADVSPQAGMPLANKYFDTGVISTA